MPWPLNWLGALSLAQEQTLSAGAGVRAAAYSLHAEVQTRSTRCIFLMCRAQDLYRAATGLLLPICMQTPTPRCQQGQCGHAYLQPTLPTQGLMPAEATCHARLDSGSSAQGWPVYRDSIDIKQGQRIVVTGEDADSIGDLPSLPISQPDFARMCEVGDNLFVSHAAHAPPSSDLLMNSNAAMLACAGVLPECCSSSRVMLRLMHGEMCGCTNCASLSPRFLMVSVRRC